MKEVILQVQRFAHVEIKFSQYNTISTPRLLNAYLDEKITNVNIGIQLDLILFTHYFQK